MKHNCLLPAFCLYDEGFLDFIYLYKFVLYLLHWKESSSLSGLSFNVMCFINMNKLLNFVTVSNFTEEISSYLAGLKGQSYTAKKFLYI